MADIISDFHGTLYRDASNGPLWKYVGYESLKRSLPRHPLRFAQLAAAALPLRTIFRRYTEGSVSAEAAYEAYNGRVLSHVSLPDACSMMAAYASRPATRAKRDKRMLDAIRDARGKKGILSTGNAQFIKMVLGDYNDAFGVVDANRIDAPHGIWEDRSRISVVVTGSTKPTRIAAVFYGRHAFRPKQSVYIGNDAHEEPAMAYVRANGGRVVMPFSATDAFKQHCASRYGAVVPVTMRDLQLALR